MVFEHQNYAHARRKCYGKLSMSTRVDRRAISTLALGNACYAAMQWFVLVLVARLTNQESVGEFRYAIALTAPVFVLANLKFREVLTTDVLRQFSWHTYVIARAGAVFVATLVVAGVGIYRSWHDVPLLLAVCLMRVGDAFSDLAYGALQRDQHHRHVGRSLITRSLVTLLIFGGALALTRNVLVAACAHAAWFIFYATIDFRAAQDALSAFFPNASTSSAQNEVATSILVPGSNRANLSATGRLRALLVQCWPLGVATSLATLWANAAAFVLIDQPNGKRMVALLAAAQGFVATGQILMGALVQTAMPALARFYVIRDRVAFRRQIKRMTMIAVTLGACGSLLSLVAGRWLLSITFGQAYAPAAWTLTLSAIAATLVYGYLFVGASFNAMRRFRVQMPIHLVSTGIGVIALLWLVPRYGLSGAGYAAIICAGCELIAYRTVARFVEATEFNRPAVPVPKDGVA